jgi:hypothetical protein
MTDWKNRWVCPHWEFHFFQEDAPDVPFAERANEGTSTFVDMLNVRGHNVNVRVDFYDTAGNKDHRFGLEGVIGHREVWSYRTDTGPHFPKPDPGVSVSASGWFEIRATEPLDIAVHVSASLHTAFARAWAFSVPVFEWPFPKPKLAPKPKMSVAASAVIGRRPPLPVRNKKRRRLPS